MRGRCSTRGTCREVRGSPTIEYCGRWLLLRGKCSTWSTSVRCGARSISVSCCVAGAALRAPPERFAKVWRRLSTMGAGCFCVASAALGGPWSISVTFCMAGAARGTSVSFCVAGAAPGERSASPATIEYCERRLLLRGRRSTWSTSVSFCVAGAALGGPQFHFAWQAQHSPAAFAAGAARWEHVSLILRGRCSTRSISVPLCVAGAALGAPPGDD